MSNVIHLNVPSPRQKQAARLAALIANFAQYRRFGDDVFWLKENAELLNILECTGAGVTSEMLAPHAAFYDRIEQRIGFFPQYYRFLLSLCLDLEDLGFAGTKGEKLAHWAACEGLAEAELSDLQRAEARRLMQRRGIDPLPHDTGLTDRLHAFIDRSDTFAMPNKKAAYELTHIVFYLSEYGRRDPRLSKAALTSLEFAGILAFLDQNSDLLAEICVAMRYAGATPSPIWENWLTRTTRRFRLQSGPQVGTADDYHDYFVCNWAMAASGEAAFSSDNDDERTAYFRAGGDAGPLRQMSECMFRLESRRSGDWAAMKPVVQDSLSEFGFEILADAEASSPNFDAFFSGFARTGLRGVGL